MKNAQLKIVAGVLAVSFFAATAPAKAGPEAASAAAQAGVERAASSILTSVKKWLKEQKRRIKENETVRQCPEGTHPSQEGENGLVCRSDRPATVTCTKWHLETRNEGEMGTVSRVVCDELDPPGGWAGTGPSKPETPQAP